MTNQLLIRKGTIEDVETIAKFNCRMAEETEGKQLEWNRVLSGTTNLVKNPKYGFYLVAEVQDSLAGSLMITTEWSDWRNGNFWWIQSVYISSDYRRQGIFSLLYNKVKEMVIEQEDVCGIRLYVENNNTIAQRTYESLGMEDAQYKVYETEI